MRTHLGEEQGRVFDISLLSVIVHICHSESGSVAVRPFEIVEQAFDRISVRESADIYESALTPCEI